MDNDKIVDTMNKLSELLDYKTPNSEEAITPSNEIDYIGVLNYLENNREIPYHNPDGETHPGELSRLDEVKEKGQHATGEIKKMAELCASKFGLDKCLPISWLDGSNTKTRRYLWAQMKYKQYEANPTSISIFVEMCSETEACYRISLLKRKVETDRQTSFILKK